MKFLFIFIFCCAYAPQPVYHMPGYGTVQYVGNRNTSSGPYQSSNRALADNNGFAYMPNNNMQAQAMCNNENTYGRPPQSSNRVADNNEFAYRTGNNDGGSRFSSNQISKDENHLNKIADHITSLALKKSEALEVYGEAYYISYCLNSKILLREIQIEKKGSFFSRLFENECLFLDTEYRRVFLIKKQVDQSSACRLLKIDSNDDKIEFWMDTASLRGWFLQLENNNISPKVKSIFIVFINQNGRFKDDKDFCFFIDSSGFLYKFRPGAFLESMMLKLSNAKDPNCYTNDFIDEKGALLYAYKR